MAEVQELKIIRDLTKLRTISPERFSKALSYMIIDDYTSYTLFMAHIEKYDAAVSSEKTKVGYEEINPEISDDLRKSFVAYVVEVSNE